MQSGRQFSMCGVTQRESERWAEETNVVVEERRLLDLPQILKQDALLW